MRPPKGLYVSFYPYPAFWAATAPDFSVRQDGDWLRLQLSEVVKSHIEADWQIHICRDSNVMLRVNSIESRIPTSDTRTMDDHIKLWGEYLDHLNALFLLLDSAAVEIDRIGWMHVSEITLRDAMRTFVGEHGEEGGSMPTESVAHIYQLARYISTYHPALPITADRRLFGRQILSMAAIDRAIGLFHDSIKSGMIGTLAAIAKSVSEHRIGNYRMSSILSWFVIESALNRMWILHLKSLDKELPDGSRRIPARRLDFLTGRDLTISIISSLLELWGLIPTQMLRDVDRIRKARNSIVHGLSNESSSEISGLALTVSQMLIEKQAGFKIHWNQSFSVPGL